MNVNSNIITKATSNYKNLGFPTQSNLREEFKTVLDGQGNRTMDSSSELLSKNNSTEEVAQVQVLQIQNVLNDLSSMIQSTYEIPETPSSPATLQQGNELKPIKLEKLVGVEKLSPETKVILKNNFKEIVDLLEKSKENNNIPTQILDVLEKLTTQVEEVKGDLDLLKLVNQSPKVEGTTKLDNSYDSNQLKEKIINFVEVAVEALKQNTKKPSKKLVDSNNSTEEVAQVQVSQIQELLKSLSSMIQSTYEIPVTPATPASPSMLQPNNELEPINLEKLVGVEKLSPETKNILKNNLNEIVDLLEKSKGNNNIPTQILDALEKLTTQVQEVKGDLNLLKLVNQSPKVEGATKLNNFYDTNQLKEKIINFVEVAVEALKQNTKKPSKELVDSNNSTEEVAQVQVSQIQELLKSLSSMIQSTYEIHVTPATPASPSMLQPNNELKPINLEKLVGVEKLSPETKDILKNNLNEIVDLLEKSKGNNKIPPQILDVIQKLATQVQEVKGDLNLLKLVNQSPKVEGTTKLNNFYDSNQLKEKIINFVEVAVEALKQNTKKPSKELVDSNNSTVEVAQVKVSQIQELLKSLSSMIQSTYEIPATLATPSTLQPNNELKSINLEKLVGVEKLSPETKNILKNNLNEIVDLLEKSKGSNNIPTQILEVLEKLTTQVQEVKGDLNLLKLVNQSPKLEGTTKLNNSYDSNQLKEKIIDFVEVAVETLKQDTKNPSKELVKDNNSTEKVAQVQVSQIKNVLKSLSSMIQSTYEIPETPATLQQDNDLEPINLEKLVGVEKLSPETKVILKNGFNEIVNFLEKSKGNDKIPLQILDVIQKLTTQVQEVKGDISLLKALSFQSVRVNVEEKSIKDSLLTDGRSQITKTTSEISPKNQMQSSSNSGQGNKFSGNSSFEEKFLNNLLGQDKDEAKISKAVNFMNQFETIKTIESPKVLTPNNLVINKNNFDVDVIKTIKLMEINNIKDLTVKMNPKELGEITVKLTMESGIMKATISAQNKDTFNLLNQNIQDIGDKLKSMDIKIQSLDINIYEDSTFFNKDSSDRNNNGRQNNNRQTNMGLDEEEIPISNNYVIEENQVNKFV